MTYNQDSIRKIVPKGKRIYWHKLNAGDTIDIIVVNRYNKEKQVSNDE